VYVPASLERVFRTAPLLVFSALTCASAIGAPLSPVTVPLIVPAVFCAKTFVAAEATSAIRRPIVQKQCLKPKRLLMFMYISGCCSRKTKAHSYRSN